MIDWSLLNCGFTGDIINHPKVTLAIFIDEHIFNMMIEESKRLLELGYNLSIGNIGIEGNEEVRVFTFGSCHSFYKCK